jgi:hypothetical protein
MKTALAPVFCGVALPSLLAAPALALESSYTATSDTSADALWAKIGDFCAMPKRLGLSCVLSGDGKTRTVGMYVEQLESRDDTTRTYSYSLVSGPLLVADYHAKLSVIPEGPRSKVNLSATYNAKGASDSEAKKRIDGILEMIANALAE